MIVRNRWFLVFCLALIGGGRDAHAQGAPSLTPSQAALKQLGATVTVAGYSLQPPLNYTLARPNSVPPAGTSVFGWVGAVRKDRTRAMLMVNLFGPPALQSQTMAPEQFLTKMLAGIKQSRLDWKQTKVETGTTHGLKYASAAWSGTHQNGQFKMKGWMMILRDGDKFIELASQDVMPYAPQSLLVAAASASTFKPSKK